MPLQRRLPKRGFVSLTNWRNAEVRLSKSTASPSTKSICSRSFKRTLSPAHTLSAKVVLSGQISRKVTLKGVGATKGARAAIEAAGGSVAE